MTGDEVMNLRVQDVLDEVEKMAPPSLAMAGDVIGLQLGDVHKVVRRVRLALEPSPTVIDSACTDGVDLLITHHALLYRAVNRIDTSTARGKAIAQALAHGLVVYNAHTNLDIADGGVNDALVDLLQLKDVRILDRMQNEQLRKFVVFVPETHHEAVMQAVCDAGAGHIGNYSHCTFNMPGEGTFVPLEGTQPYIGVHGKMERVREVRLETIVPESRVEGVVRAMLKAHPYEEVAYDLYPLEIMGKAYGIGRIGKLTRTLTLREFAELCKERLSLTHIRFGGNMDTMVERVAVLGGSGGKWVAKAISADADVLLTADCDHHTVAEAWQDGLAIVDATHAALERPVLANLKRWLDEAFPSQLEVDIATENEDPFYWV